MSAVISKEPPIRSAEGGDGLAWWREAFSWLFADLGRLLVWVGMGLVVMILTGVAQKLPLIGTAAATLLGFLFAGGLMRCAELTGRGEPLRFGEIFSGFGPRAGALAGGGLIVLVVLAALWGILLTVGLGAVLGGLAVALLQSDPNATATALIGLGGTAALALLLGLLALIPLSMAVWLAPALIMLRGVAPLDALRLSLKASWRNLGPLTVYGLVFIGLAIVATLMILLGWLFLVPLGYLSTYAAYRRLFEDAAG